MQLRLRATDFVQRPADPDAGRPTASTFPVAAPRQRADERRARRSRAGSAGTTTASACCCKGGEDARASCARPRRPSPRSRPRAPRRPAESRARLPRARARSGRGRRRAASAPRPSTRPRRPGRSPGSPAWSNKQNGYLDEAIADFAQILADAGHRADAQRGFDFSQGLPRCSTSSAQTLFERAKQERGDAERARRARRCCARPSAASSRRSTLDPENVAAHYNLALLYHELGDAGKRPRSTGASTRATGPTTTPRDRAVRRRAQRTRRPNHAAEAIVIYDLHARGRLRARRPAGATGRSERMPTDGTAPAAPTPDDERARPTTRSSAARSAGRSLVLVVLGAVAAGAVLLVRRVRPRRGAAAAQASRPRRRAPARAKARHGAGGALHRHHRRGRHRVRPRQRRRRREAAARDDGRRRAPSSTSTDDGDPDLLFVNGAGWPGRRSRRPRAPTLGALPQRRHAGASPTSPPASGLDVDVLRHGRGGGRLRQRRRPRPLRHRRRRQPPVRNATAGAFTDVDRRGGRRRRPRRLEHGRGASSTTTTTATSTCSSATTCAGRAQIDLEVDFTLTGVGPRLRPAARTTRAPTRSLYRNDGDGRFTDVSAAAGLQVANPATGEPVGKALGVAFRRRRRRRLDRPRRGQRHGAELPLPQPGRRHVRGDRRARRASPSTARATAPAPWASTRRTTATTARSAIAIGNFANEMTSLYVAQRDPWRFADEAIAEGIGAPSRLALKFGVLFFDYDLDGRLDLLRRPTATSRRRSSSVQPSQTLPPAGAAVLERRPRGARAASREVAAASGRATSRGRSSAAARPSPTSTATATSTCVLTQIGDAPLLLRNDQALGASLAAVRLSGLAARTRRAGRPGGGARRRRRPRRVDLAHALATSRRWSRRRLFGLGSSAAVERWW